MPLVRRNNDTYEGCLRDLQAFLKTSNWPLSLVTRIFYEPLIVILNNLASDQSTANGDLGKAATAALAVFKMAKSLVGDLNILAEVSDDIFDSTAHLLNYCLQVGTNILFYNSIVFVLSLPLRVDCSTKDSQIDYGPPIPSFKDSTY